MRVFARTAGAAIVGATAEIVDVQVSIAGSDEGGEASFRLVGLPDSALREGRERIKGAVLHGGWPWPYRPVTVNLAPATARKSGAGLDLAIALAVLAGQGLLGGGVLGRGSPGWRAPRGRTDNRAKDRTQDGATTAPVPPLERALCIGELTLDGRVRPVRGVLAATEAARGRALDTAFVPTANAAEAAAVGGLTVYAVAHLREAVAHLSGREPLAPFVGTPWSPEPWGGGTQGVRGQPFAIRAAWVAAAGGHNLLMRGPPGCGKTLLARQIAALMPPLSRADAVEASRIHSIAGLLEGGLLTRRPFRAPHHTTSMPGLVGGGRLPRPGEVSLAHCGVLFLDEMVEFARASLEALRQPIEDGELTVSRAAGTARFPAEVLLVAACNPCPCGWHGVGDRCRCSRMARERYGARLSGPLQDRFDLQIALRPVDPEVLLGSPEADPFDARAMESARERQRVRAREAGLPRAWNARIPAVRLPGAAVPTKAAGAHLVRFATARRLSGRGMHRVLRVARTVADLRDSDTVEVADIDLALALRAS